MATAYNIFRWNQWNVDHIAKHDVAPADAEFVVRNASNSFPQHMGDDKFLVRGQTATGMWLQVIFVIDRGIFIIHARPLTDSEKRQTRRRKR